MVYNRHSVDIYQITRKASISTTGNLCVSTFMYVRNFDICTFFFYDLHYTFSLNLYSVYQGKSQFRSFRVIL